MSDDNETRAYTMQEAQARQVEIVRAAGEGREPDFSVENLASHSTPGNFTPTDPGYTDEQLSGPDAPAVNDGAFATTPVDTTPEVKTLGDAALVENPMVHQSQEPPQVAVVNEQDGTSPDPNEGNTVLGFGDAAQGDVLDAAVVSDPAPGADE